MNTKKDMFQSIAVNDIITKLNKEILNNNDLFSSIEANSKIAKKREHFIKEYIKEYRKTKYPREEILFQVFGKFLEFNHDNKQYRFVLNNEDINQLPFYKNTTSAYIKEIEKDIFINITKDECDNLKSIQFLLRKTAINEIRYNTDSCVLVYDFIYSNYKKDPDGFLDDIEKNTTALITKDEVETIKKLHLFIFNVYELSNSLMKTESTYFFDLFKESVLNGKNILSQEKELLNIAHDIKLDQYQYEQLFVDINKKQHSGYTIKNNKVN